MGFDKRYKGIDEYAVRIIKFKARQLVGRVGFTESDREDLERYHEDLIGKATLKIGSGGTEQRIERRQHHNRQIRLKRNGDVRPDEHANDHAYDKSQDRCHYLTFLAYVTSPVTAASSVIDLLLLTCG